jgi:hypothetical protein
MMHAAIELMVFWVVAFVTLCGAVYLLAIFDGLMENDLELHPPGKEAAIAGVASLIEATGLWLIVLFIPAYTRGLGMRAMIIPILIVALIYKVAHLEDWSRYDILLLLMLQVVICCLGGSLMTAHFGTAILVVVFLGIVLAGVAFVNKGS